MVSQKAKCLWNKSPRVTVEKKTKQYLLCQVFCFLPINTERGRCRERKERVIEMERDRVEKEECRGKEETRTH